MNQICPEIALGQSHYQAAISLAKDAFADQEAFLNFHLALDLLTQANLLSIAIHLGGVTPIQVEYISSLFQYDLCASLANSEVHHKKNSLDEFVTDSIDREIEFIEALKDDLEEFKDDLYEAGKKMEHCFIPFLHHYLDVVDAYLAISGYREYDSLYGVTEAQAEVISPILDGCAPLRRRYGYEIGELSKRSRQAYTKKVNR